MAFFWFIAPYILLSVRYALLKRVLNERGSDHRPLNQGIKDVFPPMILAFFDNRAGFWIRPASLYTEEETVAISPIAPIRALDVTLMSGTDVGIAFRSSCALHIIHSENASAGRKINFLRTGFFIRVIMNGLGQSVFYNGGIPVFILSYQRKSGSLITFVLIHPL